MSYITEADPYLSLIIQQNIVAIIEFFILMTV